MKSMACGHGSRKAAILLANTIVYTAAHNSFTIRAVSARPLLMVPIPKGRVKAKVMLGKDMVMIPGPVPPGSAPPARVKLMRNILAQAVITLSGHTFPHVGNVGSLFRVMFRNLEGT